ncbi:hypothetical protein [Pseudoalteromonas luteoviolacea]|uniref:Uncharacterized protein n=1 Tax=Pseudoalteromonas luteoviolacea H33 TaxID=1365251 RepID=A0A167G3I3_9GAMM|nr:hypothetical protein [Pseudoalteromonas luteoviolacea]KZN54068.1 hypothetical protein N476_07710 [Pseudoalteromonas luteoviolacea H33]KZN78401.1 hypothetical protein N477_09815 [Pseudoalteromonas luteoviolacea H33-S]MBQ4877351.1 hypothetical protein [Pseudoalteromonas luteoviolacea]MBQ4906550.1 hypothetical protein [Pseudoalteromonas luteoviolacea]
MEKYQKVILEKYLAELRLLVDPQLIAKYPYFADKPYPLGRCKEIRNAILELLLERLAMPIIPKPLQLLERKISLGYTLKPVWGSLRDEYFQNAILIDDWYIDAANDTVNPNKPRVEIVKLAESGFSAISSFEQFCTIAQKYWQVTLYQNDLFPALAPFLPLVCVNQQGACWLGAANDDMISLARESEFRLSERILSTLPNTPQHIKTAWYTQYGHLTDHLLQRTEVEPKTFCQSYRTQHKDSDLLFRDAVVKAYLQLAKGVNIA